MGIPTDARDLGISICRDFTQLGIAILGNFVEKERDLLRIEIGG